MPALVRAVAVATRESLYAAARSEPNQPSVTKQSLLSSTMSAGAVAAIARFTLTTKPTFWGWRR